MSGACGLAPVLRPLATAFRRRWLALWCWGLDPAAADSKGIRLAALARADLERG